MHTGQICFRASQAPAAQQALARLTAVYGNVAPEAAEVIVPLGGDGFMLQTLHATAGLPAPVYGMNRGTIGFLMNEFSEDALPARLAAAEPALIHPLRMEARDLSGAAHSALAINEVSLLRQTHQTAHLRILVDDRERIPELVCDGALVATPAGSTAYNYSAHGPILPIRADVLALTAISAFRPRRWRGAILPSDARVRMEVLNAEMRPVSAVADNVEVRDVAAVDVSARTDVTHTILFDPGHGLEERLLREQFA